MIEFENEKIKRLAAKIKKLTTAITIVVLLCFCFAVTIICIAADAPDGGAVYNFMACYGVVISIVIYALLIAVIVLLIALKVNAEKQLKFEVCTILSTALFSNSELLCGADTIALTAIYAVHNLTLSRQNSKNEVNFNLSAIKKAPKIYSSFGTYLLEYLQAFYALHAKEFKSVTVQDGKDIIVLVGDGQYCKNKNYFIEKGMIK